jgi:hypothetical protein
MGWAAFFLFEGVVMGCTFKFQVLRRAMVKIGLHISLTVTRRLFLTYYYHGASQFAQVRNNRSCSLV